jgi:hypothetical protein
VSDETPYESLDDLGPPAAPAPAAKPRPEVVTQHYIDPDTGERKPVNVRIIRRGRRRPKSE